MYFICQNAPEFEKCAQQAALLQKQLTAVRERVRFFSGSDGKITGNGYYLQADCLINLPNGRIAVYHLSWGGYPHSNNVHFIKDYTANTLHQWLHEYRRSCSVSFEEVQKAGFDFAPLIKEMEFEKCLYLA